ncbi:ECF transporter S component [Acrocarpospora catenulata]|uniref:ECF transporter S component n=1 Tax=Acrocarpospora catenulata TaxID=2836182 RepID=UPI001BD9BE3D|nr:ECF transporter S component [Acrocarpospora catenulata]
MSTSELAVRSPWAWRTVDFVVTAVLAVAFGVIFWGWDHLYGLAFPLFVAFPPTISLIGGVWTIAAVVGAAIVRRPGAALLTEVLAAAVELLLGNQFAVIALVSGLLYGVGIELVLAAFRWKRWGLPMLALGIAFGAFLQSFWGVNLYHPTWSLGWKIANGVGGIISAAVIGAGLGWVITRALARAGVLNAFPIAREVSQVAAAAPAQ